MKPCFPLFIQDALKKKYILIGRGKTQKQEAVRKMQIPCPSFQLKNLTPLGNRKKRVPMTSFTGQPRTLKRVHVCA